LTRESGQEKGLVESGQGEEAVESGLSQGRVVAVPRA
jgi:hypothetical protein